jgi:hypothetical protein
MFLIQVPEKYSTRLQEIITKLRWMRTVYRASKPSPADVAIYKETAVKMGQILIDDFPWVRWPNYLHKVIEHVDEIINRNDGLHSVGIMSGEGNEAGNKLFRQFRRSHSSRGSTTQSLLDILKLHWLYTSPKLQQLSEVSHKKYKCGICGEIGHTRVTCHVQPRSPQKHILH